MRIQWLIMVLWAVPMLAGAALSTNEAAPAKTVVPTASQQHERVVMARVGAYEITVQEFMEHLAKHAAWVNAVKTPKGKAQFLRILIRNSLLTQAMQKEGLISENPSPDEFRKAFQKFATEHFPLPKAPDEKTLKAFYQAHLDRYSIPDTVRLSQIQIRLPENATEEQRKEARKRAEAALQRIEQGEAFADVAAEVTEHPRGKQTKGDLGYFPRAGSAWLEKALQGLAKGDHTGVMEAPGRYDIYLITEEKEAITTPFDEVRDQVTRDWQFTEQNRLRDAYAKQLAAKVKVEIVEDDLKPYFTKGIFP